MNFPVPFYTVCLKGAFLHLAFIVLKSIYMSYGPFSEVSIYVEWHLEY
jgi:hypothetical protein